jgi:Holliday junction resolvase-like predicted endonuclease
VKTRTAEGLAPPEAAVDRAKKGHILAVARRYVRRLPGKHPPPCRFDIVSIVLGGHDAAPKIRLQKGAFEWEADRPWRRAASHQWSRSYWRDRR